jgi:hypothetical protein
VTGIPIADFYCDGAVEEVADLVLNNVWWWWWYDRHTRGIS